MSHTKRVYQDPNYNGPHKWYFVGWHRDKPWRQLSNKLLVFWKDMGATKRLMQKRRRQANRRELKEIYQNYVGGITGGYIEDDKDTLSHLIPVWDEYMYSFYPFDYNEDYW